MSNIEKKILKEHPELLNVFTEDGELIITTVEQETMDMLANQLEGMQVKEEYYDSTQIGIQAYAFYLACIPEKDEEFTLRNLLSLVKGYLISRYPAFLYKIALIASIVKISNLERDFYRYFLEARKDFTPPKGLTQFYEFIMTNIDYDDKKAVLVAKKTLESNLGEIQEVLNQ